MARPASARSTLVPVLTLLAGLAIGWASSPFDGAPAEVGAAPRAASPASSAAAMEANAVEALDASSEASTREQAVVAAPALASGNADAVVAAPEEAPEPAPASLTAELTAILRSGRIEAALAAEAPRMLRQTVEAYLAAGAPREALALLERHPGIESHLYDRVGYMLIEAGDSEGAASAFLAQLERSGAEGLEPDALANLARLDPAAALAFLDRQAGGLDDFLEAELLPQRAALLARTGQGEASLAILRRLAAQGGLDDAALEALESLPPEQAESLLREAAPLDAQGASTVALARLLSGDERTPEAIALLRDLLARQPDNEAALSTLFTLDAAASLEHIAGGSRELQPRVWMQAGNALQAQGRTADAVDAWLRAFDGDPSDWQAGDALREHAPHVLWPRTEALAADTRDDELLGDLADLNWRAGRHDRAVELWRRARAIDPSDGEWTGKLRAVSQGRDPL